jgi:hypothetical protein
MIFLFKKEISKPVKFQPDFTKVNGAIKFRGIFEALLSISSLKYL